MSDDARVSSVEAVQEFYAAVRTFQGDAETAVLMLEQQVSKVIAYYDHDLPLYWKNQVKRAYDLVDRARSAYDSCKLRTVAGQRSACYEEKQALAAAKRRLEFCQNQVEVVNRWGTRLGRVIDEFRGQSGRFKNYLSDDVEKTAGLLLRTLSSLEAYLGRSLSDAETTEPSSGGDT